MQSNSKLNNFEKALFKDYRKMLPDVQFAIMGKTTIAFKHVGDNVEFATAICADNEKKNRPKVGQYYALSRFNWGATVKLPVYQFETMLESNCYDSGNFG